MFLNKKGSFRLLLSLSAHDDRGIKIQKTAMVKGCSIVLKFGIISILQWDEYPEVKEHVKNFN
jgi:hypothetical protein